MPFNAVFVNNPDGSAQSMKILIAGIDGYLGWTLASHQTDRGHVVAGIDNGFRRDWVSEMGSVRTQRSLDD